MRRLEFLGVFVGLLVLLCCLRIALVLMVAPEIPFYDEWDSVMDLMARPMLAGNFSLTFLLTPHNEHIVFWTKALSYLFLQASDLQFDNVPVCELNQLIYAGIASALITLAAKNLGSFKWWFIISAGIAAALPYGWENIGVGWGNPYYFLLGFSGGAILMASCMRGSLGALVSLGLLAIAACTSMASGFFAAIIVMVIAVLRTRIKTLSVPAGVGMAVAMLPAIAVTITLTAMRNTGTTLSLGVVQLTEFLALLLLWFPTWWLMLQLWHRQGSNADIAFVCIALWGLMQICAILLGRPTFKLWFPISRYVDILAVASFANIGCLCRLAINHPSRWRWRELSRSTLAAVIIVTVALSPMAWHWLNVRADHEREQTQILTRYIHDGDVQAIQNASMEHLPYPIRERLQHLADAEDVRWILGDKIGTRLAPAPFVAGARSFNALLVRHVAWLLPLLVLIGFLSLSGAWRCVTATREQW